MIWLRSSIAYYPLSREVSYSAFAAANLKLVDHLILLLFAKRLATVTFRVTHQFWGVFGLETLSCCISTITLCIRINLYIFGTYSLSSRCSCHFWEFSTGRKKSKFQTGGLDDFPLVARAILNHFEIGNIGFDLYCHTEVHENVWGRRLHSFCFIEYSAPWSVHCTWSMLHSHSLLLLPCSTSTTKPIVFFAKTLQNAVLLARTNLGQ